MTVATLLSAALCLLPVLCFLAALFFLDSYELVPLRLIVAMLGVGMAAAGASYLANAALIGALGSDLEPYTRHVSPLVEEALKALVIVWLIRTHRVGFLVDAAIVGFALGSGFAVVENLYALWRIPDAGVSTWVVRGFGTAVMHGGASAGFAVVSLAILERDERHGYVALLPGFTVAVLLHAAFNRLSHQPVIATVAVLVAVPTLVLVAYHHGERTLAEWLGHGFDADAERLALMRSGGLAASPTGRYLSGLKTRFSGPVMADLLGYLRLFTELSLRAKGMLLMRENGFEAEIDEETRGQLKELEYLEKNIGVTGLMALHPLLPMRRKSLRQLYLM